MNDDVPDWYKELPDANSSASVTPSTAISQTVSLPVEQTSQQNDIPEWYGSMPDAIPPTQASAQAPTRDNQNESGTYADIGKTLIGNVTPNAAANLAANLASAPATVGSYAAQVGTKGGEYLGEGANELYNLATSQPQKTQADFDYEQKELMNAIRKKIGLSPSENGDISQLVPTPSNLLNAGMNAMGTPLYQPKTEAGQTAATFGNIATAGAGSGAKLLPSLMGAAASTGAGETIKQAGGTQAEQFIGSLAGGIGGGALGSIKAPNRTPMTDVEDQNTAAFLGPKSTAESASPIIQKLSNGERVTSDDVNQHATDIGNAAKVLGATLTPQFSQKWLDATKGPDPTTPVEITNAQTDPLRQFLKPYEDNGFGKSPVSLSDLTSLDKSLGDLAWKERDAFGNISPAGRRILAAQQDLRQRALNASPENGDAIGDTDGIGALNYARQLYAQGFRMADIERVQEKADNANAAGKDGAQVARNGYLSMLNNGKKTVGWDDDELMALRGATKSGAAGRLLSVANSKLIPIIAAGLGHLDMGATALGMQKVLGLAANKLQQSRTNNLFNTVAGRDFGNQPDYIAMAAVKRSAPAPLQLEAPPIRVPEGGFGTTQDGIQTPDINYNPGQQALPKPREMQYEDMVKAGRILPYQPRPDFVGTPEGRVGAIPNEQVGQYQFGQSENMPFQPGELNEIRARHDQYQNMPISSPRGQSAFMRSVENPGIPVSTVTRSQSEPIADVQHQYFSNLLAEHAINSDNLNNELSKERPFFQNEYATGAKNVALKGSKGNASNPGKNVQGNERQSPKARNKSGGKKTMGDNTETP